MFRFVLLTVVLLAALSGCTGLPVETPTPTVEVVPVETLPPAVTPEPVITEQPVVDIDEGLTSAIAGRDFAAMQSLMSDRFLLAGWRSEGRQVTPAEAVAELEQVYFGQGSNPSVDFSADTSALLEGADPLAFFGPDAVRVAFVDGLGPQAADEAIIAVSRDPADGQEYWSGILIAMGGFLQDQALSDLNLFGTNLAAALENRDFTNLRAMMAESFLFAYGDRELRGIPADEAIQQMRDSVLAEGSLPVVVPGIDVVALLNGADPLGLWGPVVSPVKAVYVEGLGASAAEQAVVVIGRNEDTGRFYFLGMLLPDSGYFQAAP